MSNQPEHRRAIRNRLDDVEVLAISGVDVVRVFDVSEGGLALLTDEQVAPGTELDLHVGGADPVKLEVCYCEPLAQRSSALGQRYRLGTRFTDHDIGPDHCSQIMARHLNLAVYEASAQASESELVTPPPGENRRATRQPVPALASQANGRSVTIHDVSCDGLSLITAEPLLPGEAFSMSFPDYPSLELVVRHCDPLLVDGQHRYRVGARFIVPEPDHPLYATSLDAFIASLVLK